MKEYIKYYRALLKTKSITIEQKEAEIKVQKQFTEIINQVTNEKRETITENTLEKEINKMKRKKAGEQLGSKA